MKIAVTIKVSYIFSPEEFLSAAPVYSLQPHDWGPRVHRLLTTHKFLVEMKKKASKAGHGSASARQPNGQQAAIERREWSYKLIKELYRGINGHQLSKSGKQGMANGSCKSLTYGEIVPQSFCQILDLIKRNCVDCGSGDDFGSSQPLVFVDLGCGIGRAVMSAALSSTTFSRCWGIELMPSLADAAFEANARLAKYLTSPHLLDGPSSCACSSSVSSKLTTAPTIAGADDSSPCGRDDVISKIVSLLESAPGSSQTAESLANSVCSALGHKALKNALKKYQAKKFSVLLKQFPDLFEVTDLLSEVVVTLKVEGSKETEQVDGLVGELGDPDTLEDADAARAPTQKELEYQRFLQENAGALFAPTASVEFTCGDIFEIDWWSTADVVYCASLLFTDAMMVQLSELVYKMKVGSWFVSLKPLSEVSPSGTDSNCDGQSAAFRLVDESFFKMSWQMAKVYIYRIVAC
jgi:hypothetical protein